VEFQSSDLGYLSAGDVVRVTIRGDGPNVRIFDSSNFRAFKSGQRAKYYGGHAQRSPVAIQVPHAGHWHLVIDFGGYAGRAQFSVDVVRAA
jgi:hypothetical protein